MSELSENILNKIRKEKIEPKPKWQFLLKEYLIWFLFVVSVVLGSVAFAVMLHFAKYGDYFYFHYQRHLLYRFITSLPFLWIILLLFFWFIAYYNLKHSRRGYKYTTGLILFLSIFISLIFGTGLFLTGFGSKAERALEKRFNFYKSLDETREEFWSDPENGYLGGYVEEIVSEKEFILIDFHGEVWTIKLQRRVNIQVLEKIEDRKIQIQGRLIDNHVFEASEIEPWKLEKRNVKIYIQTSERAIRILRVEGEI